MLWIVYSITKKKIIIFFLVLLQLGKHPTVTEDIPMTEVQLKQSIDDATKKSSISRLTSFCHLTGLSGFEPAKKSDTELFSNMVLIILSGPKIKQTFKVFFNATEALPFVEKTYKKNLSREQLSKYSIDTFKEIANLVAGHIKILLEKTGLRCEISLPIALRGYDDLFFSDKNEGSKYKSYWKIRYQGEELIFSNLIEIDKPKLKNDFVYIDKVSNIEFF